LAAKSGSCSFENWRPGRAFSAPFINSAPVPWGEAVKVYSSREKDGAAEFTLWVLLGRSVLDDEFQKQSEDHCLANRKLMYHVTNQERQ
jgi:hypothetical protein